MPRLTHHLAERPALGTPVPWTFPEPEVFSLSTGLEVHYYPMPTQHIATIVIVMPHASIRAERPGHTGAASLALSLVADGVDGLPGPALDEALEADGIDFSTAISSDSSMVMMTMPASRTTRATELLVRMMTSPLFEEEDVTRTIALRQASISQQWAHPSALAAWALPDMLYANWRMKLPLSGSMSDISTLTREDIEQFFHHNWAPHGSTCIVAGNVDIDSVISYLHQWTGSSHEDITPLVEPREDPSRLVWIVDKPGAVQADITIAHLAPTRDHPAWPALRVATQALGGSFASRLNHVLREERGLTYGAHAQLSPGATSAILSAHTQCRTEVTAEALVTALEILDIADTPLSEEEVSTEISAMVNGVSLRYPTSTRVAQQAASLAEAQLPSSWLSDYHTNLAHVSCEDATAAWKRWIPISQAPIVICGDGKSILASLEGTDLHPEIVDPRV